MSNAIVPLTSDEQATLWKAAYGAVTLVSLAYPGGISATRENIAGAKVLTGATGIVGQVLSGKQKVKLKGTAADVAGQVLPALTATVATLDAKAPHETQEFRRVVTTAVEQAAASTRGGANPAQSDMIGKITAALAAA